MQIFVRKEKNNKFVANRGILKQRYLVNILVVAILSVQLSCTHKVEQHKLFALRTSDETGIYFNNTLEETHQMNVLEYQDFYSGGGVSVGDLDGDGLPEVFFTGNQVPAKLFKNMGKMRFEDITDQAGLGRMGRGWYTGTVMADINGDGHLDIYISKSGMEAPDDRANLCFINNGDGTFTEKAKSLGLAHQGFAVNAAFFDYDKDGDLDMYLVNQGPRKLKSGNARALRNQRDTEAGDVLFENMGNRFEDVTEEAGLFGSVIGFAHGVSVGDVNNDGWDDIFVSNDFFEYDYLYVNNMDKTFSETIKSATKHISYYSMGNDVADFNNDGLPDIVVLDMIAEGNRRLYSNLPGMNLNRFRNSLGQGLHHQYMSNMLHLNRGKNTFSDVGHLAGISNTDWSWAPLFADFDNDGWKDLYITNGIRKDVRDIDWGRFYFDVLRMTGGEHTFTSQQWDMLLRRMPSEPVQNYVFRNKGDLSFEKVMGEWGMDQRSWSNGVAYGDLDGDGDLDLVVNNIDQEAFVYENQQEKNSYLRFSFEGPPSNPYGIGTKVRIFIDSLMQYQQHFLARGYRSSMEPIMHFGLGQDTMVHKVEIAWPDGKLTTYYHLPANQVIELRYEEAEFVDMERPLVMDPLFQTLETMTLARHDENEMEDFLSAPTLPYKLSSLGPALAVGDVDGDGNDDFYLGGAFRRPGQLLVHNGMENGSYNSRNASLWQDDRMCEDVAAVFFDIENDGDLDLYVVSGGSEHAAGSSMMNDRLYLNDGHGNFSKSEGLIPAVGCSGGVARPADFDDDGDTDLFVGGRQVPGQYLSPASSYLLENQGGKLTDVTAASAGQLQDLGMVTDALWADYDTDGDTDLVLVGEWMPIAVFQNSNGVFTKVENYDNGLEHSDGWWWSIAGADVDNDGDVDFLAGNLGYNYKAKASPAEPLVAYAGDFDGDDRHDLAIGYHQNGVLYPVFDRSYALSQNRGVAEKVPDNQSYAVASLEDIFGEENLERCARHQMQTLATSYFENLGDGRFRMQPLENWTQISVVNSIVVADANSDGYQDFIMAGNLHTMEVRTVRLDGSIGAFFRGEGNGNFTYEPNGTSGLLIDGDVRRMELLNIQGARHLIVAKNNDAVQIIKFEIPSLP
jgi:hypothetical protein